MLFWSYCKRNTSKFVKIQVNSTSNLTFFFLDRFSEKKFLQFTKNGTMNPTLYLDKELEIVR